MKQKYGIIITLVLLLSVFAVVLFNRQSETVSTDSVEKMSIGIVGDTSTLVLLAQQQGFFEQRGLDVEIKHYGVGAAALNDLLLGKVDVAVGSEYVGTLNSFQSSDFKIIASIAKTTAYEVVARTDHGIFQPSDISGKKIGTTLGTAGEYWLDVFLTATMLTREDVEVISMRPPELTEALISGSIDAVLNLEPHTQNAKKELPGNTISFRGQRGQGVYSVLYASQDIINSRPEVLNKLMQSLIDAEGFFAENPDEAYDFITKYFDYTPEYVQDVVVQKYDFKVLLEQALILIMEDEARWMINKKLVDEVETPNYLNYLYLEPLKSVNPDAITVIYNL